MNFYFPLILFCFSTTITPGPNNLMIMMSSLTFGIKKTFPHYLGICIGFAIMVLAIGLGLESIFTAYPAIHLVIKIIGSMYMLWLAWKILTSSTKINNEAKQKPLNFIQAALFQWINPKAWVMAIGAVSTYTYINGAISMLAQVIIISLVYLTVSIPCIAAWMYGGKIFSNILTHDKHVRIFNLILGLMLIVSIVIMIFE